VKALLGLRFIVSKIIKIIKIIKKEKKSKIKGYGTRFARVVSRAKAKSKALIMYSLRSYVLKSKSSKVRTLRDALYLPFKIERELVIREKALQKF
jgi:hypothetical protein